MGNWTRWTSEMDSYLISKYEWIGDTYLADLFESKFPKKYPWTKKHIEKRRWYLGLKRTKEQENYLRCLNNKDGRHSKMWDSRGRMKEREVREWDGRKYIKINGKTILYNRFLVNAKPGQVVRSHEGKLEIISKEENQLRNAKIRASIPDDLKKTIKLFNKLKKIVYGKKNAGS